MWDLATLIRMNDERVERYEREERERVEDAARSRAYIKKGIIAQSRDTPEGEHPRAPKDEDDT
jgi:hypothetical protein